jgi:hypothetical protein
MATKKREMSKKGKLRDLPKSDLSRSSQEVTQQEAEAVTGGEIKDFSFGVENPTTIGSATGGAGAGKIKFAPSQA